MISRREVIRILGATPILAFIPTGLRNSIIREKLPVRLPLEEFVESKELLDGIRQAVREMKKRKPSDKLSWFFQSAIHGVSTSLLADAEASDPNVGRIFQKKYLNQCPHFGDSSANFLPWHRAYTFHFERIVRFHSGLSNFALPYWNYNDLSKPENRRFPKEFGIEHLDGDLNNNNENNLNPLFIVERSFYFAGYEHPLTDALPLVSLTPRAVDPSLALASPVFFGNSETEGIGGAVLDENPSTRGLLESSPHDQIHRAVGGIIGATTGDPSVGFMANPPTAAFDPIFSVHHTNIDRLWAKWSCLKGKSWGKLPSDYWFNERPWFFIDVDGSTVNRPRKEYFDYRALGIRFKDDDLSCKPLELPDSSKRSSRESTIVSIRQIAEIDGSFGVAASKAAVANIPESESDRIKSRIPQMALFDVKRQRRIILTLRNIKLGLIEGTGFDVFLTDEPSSEMNRSQSEFVGSINLFAHAQGADEHRSPQFHRGTSQSFDISMPLSKLKNKNFRDLNVVISPFSLFESADARPAIVLERSILTIGGMEINLVDIEE